MERYVFIIMHIMTNYYKFCSQYNLHDFFILQIMSILTQKHNLYIFSISHKKTLPCIQQNICIYNRIYVSAFQTYFYGVQEIFTQCVIFCILIHIIIKISQNKGKEILPEIEVITVGQAHENTRKLYRNISTGMAVFINLF